MIYVIGDSHIGLKAGDEDAIVAWLTRLEERQPKALYLNGDIFHYYIGHPNFLTPSIHRFFAKLREMRERGIAIHYVEGNRDFFVKGSLAEESVTDTKTEYTVEIEGKRYLIIHGDTINDRDWPYRFWRLASKNVITRAVVGMIPKNTARKFVDRMEKKLARSNFKHKTRIPTELMAAWGARRGEAGYHAVVFGHFHKKLVIPAGKATVAVLPAWYQSGEAIAISPATGEYEFVAV